MDIKLLPPMKYLRECFYEDNGVLYWKKRPLSHFNGSESQRKRFATRYFGTIAGRPDADGRIQINITKYGQFMRSRIVFALHNGFDPGSLLVDHKDGDVTNDKIGNLRIATESQNITNRGMQRNNTSGYRGVFYHKKQDSWYSRIVVNGERIFLGCFKDPESAYKAYCEASQKYHGGFSRVTEWTKKSSA